MTCHASACGHIYIYIYIYNTYIHTYIYIYIYIYIYTDLYFLAKTLCEDLPGSEFLSWVSPHLGEVLPLDNKAHRKRLDQDLKELGNETGRVVRLSAQ